MKGRHGQPRGLTRLARTLGLDRLPLRRATDRAEAWVRVGLLAVFLIAGPMAALGAGHWAYHAGITAARVPAAPTHRVKPAALRQAPTITDLPGSAKGAGPGPGPRPVSFTGFDDTLAVAAVKAGRGAPDRQECDFSTIAILLRQVHFVPAKYLMGRRAGVHWR